MVNDCIRVGLANEVSSLRRLSLLSYNQLAHYDSPSYYKLCAISRAAGILAARKKSLRRGFPIDNPILSDPAWFLATDSRSGMEGWRFPSQGEDVSVFP
jgi:putative transposase